MKHLILHLSIISGSLFIFLWILYSDGIGINYKIFIFIIELIIVFSSTFYLICKLKKTNEERIWININDRFPTLDKEGFVQCLVAFKEGGVSHARYNAKINKFQNLQYQVIDYYTVTHWMLLPVNPNK